jgi:hypothetical protein
LITIIGMLAPAIFASIYLVFFYGRALRETGSLESAWGTVVGIALGFIPFAVVVVLLIWIIGGWGPRYWALRKKATLLIPSFVQGQMRRSLQARNMSKHRASVGYPFGVTLTADNAGITLWRRWWTPQVYEFFPWSEIHSIEVTRIPSGSTAYNGIRIAFTDFDQPVDVPLFGRPPLGLYTASRRGTARTAEVLTGLLDAAAASENSAR